MSGFLEQWEEKGDRIVVFAGVFDPVHTGHIAAAKKARTRHNHIVYIPEREPQHKKQVTAYKHRLRMLEIAMSHETDMEVLNYPEAHHYIRPLFSWLRERYPNRSFSWVIGSDVLPLIESWKDADLLGSYGVKEIVAITRADYAVFPIRLIAGIPVRKVGSDKRHLSSSWVRGDLRHRHTALPKGVYEYIREHKLYGL